MPVNSKPLVSVVIPAYNAENVITRAIDSVLSQSYDNFEIIVVDDDSTDETVNQIKSYSEERIVCIKNQVNKGASATRNVGIEEAAGKYIAFLDADDEWLPEKLETQVSTIERKSSDWVAVHCRRMDKNGVLGAITDRLAKLIGSEKESPTLEGDWEVIGELLTLNVKTGTSTFLVRREIVEDIGGFDDSFERHQDWEFLVRVLKNGKIAYVDKPLVIKHPSPQPSPESKERSKRLLHSKFSDEIKRLEEDGYPVTKAQNLHLAKSFIKSGAIIKGFRRVPWRQLSLANTPELVWSLWRGIGTLIKKYSP